MHDKKLARALCVTFVLKLHEKEFIYFLFIVHSPLLIHESTKAIKRNAHWVCGQLTEAKKKCNKYIFIFITCLKFKKWDGKLFEFSIAHMHAFFVLSLSYV